MVDSSSQALNYLANVPVPVALSDAERRAIREEAEARENLLEYGLEGW